MNSPLVSVVLPVYNREQYVARAIESVITQSYAELELVIIDDGSNDTTPSIIKQYGAQDRRIRFLYDKQHKGVVRRLNEAILTSKGKYIARLDDDDFWCDKEKLEKQVHFLEDHPDYVLIGGGHIRINSEGMVLGRYISPQNDEEIRRAMLISNPCANSAAVFRKSSWEKVGRYDESLDLSEDWDLWMKLGTVGKCYNVQEYVAIYLRGDQNRSYKNLRLYTSTNLMLKRRYRNFYPHFWRAYVRGWAAYISTFLPAFLQKMIH